MKILTYQIWVGDDPTLLFRGKLGIIQKHEALLGLSWVEDNRLDLWSHGYELGDDLLGFHEPQLPLLRISGHTLDLRCLLNLLDLRGLLLKTTIPLADFLDDLRISLGPDVIWVVVEVAGLSWGEGLLLGLFGDTDFELLGEVDLVGR